VPTKSTFTRRFHLSHDRCGESPNASSLTQPQILDLFPSTFSSFVAYDKVSDHANWSMPSSKVLTLPSIPNLCGYGSIPFPAKSNLALLAKNKNFDIIF